ncbi:MAG: hypothetical protein H7X93_11845 [Sphingomonadaceae bacterium]|nr:hypothetical protein [Sphingomonadaceae bacterium]
MAERPHLFVHAGFPKTGSSALQYWLDTNTAALAQAGVSYPRGPSAADAPGRITSGNGKPLSHYLSPPLRRPGFDAAAFDESFRRFYLATDKHKILVSSEQIGSHATDMLQTFKQDVVPDVELTFVVFLRDLYGSARSKWMQGVKRTAWTMGFDEYVASHAPTAVHKLKSMAQILGPDNVRVLHYDSVAADIVGALLEAIGVDKAIGGGISRPGLVNRSLTSAETRVLIECSRRHGQRRIARLLSDHFMDRHPDRVSTHLPDPAIVDMLAEKFSAEIRWVNNTFFGGRGVFGAGGREPSTPGGGAEMKEEEVWSEVALLLADALAAQLGPERSLDDIRNKTGRRQPGPVASRKTQ